MVEAVVAILLMSILSVAAIPLISSGVVAYQITSSQVVTLSKLRYATERVLEIYYSVAIGKGASIAANYQRVANPGFNADRGPASFYGVRLHWEN